MRSDEIMQSKEMMRSSDTLTFKGSDEILRFKEEAMNNPKYINPGQ
jgi:hypothetical protein